MNRTQFMKESEKFKRIFGFNPPIDRTAILIGKSVINIIEFDRLLEKYTPGYNKDECTYNGKKNYSVEMVVNEVYGKSAVEIVRKMMKWT